MLWTSLGKFGTLGIQFTTNIVLARLLMPEDFGAIGMLTIFIALSEVFISAGFGQALIQKKSPTPIDYTTVFYWNLLASIVMYLLLFIGAPSIANFYKMPILEPVLRLQGLTLIISGFSIVQSNLLQKRLNFKKLYIRSTFSALIGSCIAIFMAFHSFGIWSLVASSLSTAFINALLLWFSSPWHPTLAFSTQSFKELFSFGSLMAVSSIIDQLYQEIQGLIIGKMYSAVDLGFYTQAKKLQNIPTSSLSQIVSQVTFPVFSEMQNDLNRMRNGVSKVSKAVTYLNFPLMMLLIVIATPLITLLYGDKWVFSIPYFRVLCLTGMFYTILTTNNSVIKSLGRSGIFLKIRILQRSIGLTLISFGATFSVMGILYGALIGNIVNYLIVSWYTSKLIGYGFIKQVKDIGMSFILSIFSAFIATLTKEYLPTSPIIVIGAQIIVYLTAYIFFSYLFKLEAFSIFTNIAISKIRKH